MVDRDFNNKPKYKNTYKKYRRGMTRNEYLILWTAIWLIFIFGFCMLFDSAMPMWLLVIWFIGMM